MGWSFPWVSSADGDFNFDFGVSYTDAQVRERMWAMLEGDTPPVFIHLASETGTDVAGYLSEVPGFSAFGLAEGAVYHTYSHLRPRAGVPDGLLPILDRAPMGRNERGSSQLWIRRHDECEHADAEATG